MGSHEPGGIQSIGVVSMAVLNGIHSKLAFWLGQTQDPINIPGVKVSCVEC